MTTNFPFNVLGAAQTVIRKQPFIYRRHTGRAANSAGLYIDTYAADENRTASVQPVSRSLYEKMGLDFEKSYISILDTESIFDIGRDASGDRIVFNGQVYKVNGKTDWETSAGWNRVVCVRIEAETS